MSTGKVRGMLASPPPTWVVLGIAAIGLAVWFLQAWIMGQGWNEPKRWRAAGMVMESAAFVELSKPPPHLGPELPSATEPPVVLDWTRPHVAVYSAPATPTPTAAAVAANAEGEDPYKFNRALVATVTRGDNWDPGDRMIWTRVFIQPINFVFTAYTVAATDNETVKLASIESSQTRKLAADLALTVPGLEGPKASVDPSVEHTAKTTTDISEQYEKLGIDITPKFLRIIRESESGGDVVGNTTVALSIATDPRIIWKTFPASFGESRDDDIVLRVINAHLDNGALELTPKDGATITVLPENLLPHCALRAKVWMLYEQRHIVAGREFYNEARQEVDLLRDVDEPKSVEVVDADDVSPAVWSIKIVPKPPASKARDDASEFLSAHVHGGMPRKLVFTSFSLASGLAHWIRTNQGATLSNLEFNYTPGDSVVPFRKSDDECQPGAR